MCPCYSPLTAWRGAVLPSGKRELVFKRPRDKVSWRSREPLPCGQCVGCRLERSRQWAMRCVHEASLYSDNSFITLTYNDAHLPFGSTLVKRDFVLFMKMLRYKANVPAPGLRFFHCGEYGELCVMCKLPSPSSKAKAVCKCPKYIPGLGRPHDHALIFNFDFKDKYLFKVTARGDRLYRSSMLESLWTKGQSMIGDVTFESAAYVARYVLKKIQGRDTLKMFMRYYDFETDTLRVPEYVTMSRRPGIGSEWYKKYKRDIFPGDFAIMRGMRVRPPKFYCSRFEMEDPSGFAEVKAKRIGRVRSLDPTGLGETGMERLRVKEKVKEAQIKALSRKLEV